ncbi:MAG: TolC family outer membrane protein, partial [Acetobacteraceae bacterium]|nr:TolC family outer membrane protein [Acetobacteraceae bacterium]
MKVHGWLLGMSMVLIAGPVLAQPARSSQPTLGGAAPRPAATGMPAGPPASAVTGARTIQEALAATYLTDPMLLEERARLRATDEGVPQALAGWRPTVIVSGNVGYQDGLAKFPNGKSELTADMATAMATITQPVYRGGRTQAQTHQAENNVLAERARLIAQEEQSFINTVNAYVGVIQNQQILQLNINNEQVLRRQLQATNDRFRVGEITRTDVAQAEASLAGAIAQRETAAGNLATARAMYQRSVGALPPGNLVEPQPLGLPVRTEQQAVALAAANNANVIANMFAESAARDAIDVAYSALMPTVNVVGQSFFEKNPSTVQRHSQLNGYSVTAQLSVPLYQGGAEYSMVRQARQNEQLARKALDDARRAAVQQAIQAWETLVAARATADSTRSQIVANQIALEGVEREAIVGSRTTLDV